MRGTDQVVDRAPNTLQLSKREYKTVRPQILELQRLVSESKQPGQVRGESPARLVSQAD
jgi:hypothetical protein